ncbi:putative HECT-type ubiquitin ligase-interacting protein creD [Talaromyces pinophilus]|nr:putative HECT-type ubiquitin ligase-interacting protein creD [Talaromyces pinophilus]
MFTPRVSYLVHDDREIVTFVSEQAIGSSKTLNSFQLPAGNYEFPFRIPLTSKMLETIAGPCQYHSYEVQAIIEHRFRSDSVVAQPIRIYRTPALEVGYRMTPVPTTIQGQAQQDIQYSISMPDLNIPFGSKFPVKCWFAPLSKNLKLIAVKITVVERHSLRVDPTAAESVMYNLLVLTSMKSHILFTEERRYSTETLSLDGDVPPTEWCLDLPVSLPDSFESCTQSISTKPIKITHELVVKAEFQDTATLATAEVEEKINFAIYMTPSVIGADAVIHSGSLECFTEDGDTLPPYSCHHSDIIPTGWSVCASQIGMRTAEGSTGCESPHEAIDSVPFISNFDNVEPPAYESA